MKKALVLGAGGFIGNHMVNRLKSEGYFVVGADLKLPEYSRTSADQFYLGNLTKIDFVQSLLLDNNSVFDEIYQYAADMGGAGFVFTGENDAEIMHNSALINLNVLNCLISSPSSKVARIFYSSSACMYPEYNQMDPNNPKCDEDSAYPAAPDSEYGWEKLFSERLYLAYNRNHNINIAIARFHNIYGPLGTWEGGREKAPAAICRKIALIPEKSGEIEVWGDGQQTRSFLFVDECIEATRRLMSSPFNGPINIGSEEMVTITELVDLVAEIAGKNINKRYILDAPVGVRGRNSDNNLIRKTLNWDYQMSLKSGIEKTYLWIADQIAKRAEV
jgi:nucleoside-diphosphate-sugar epimerase